MKHKSLKIFLNEVTGLFDQKVEVRSQEMEKLIERWRTLIVSYRLRGQSQAEEYREWYHLKLSVEWIRKTMIIEKKSPILICFHFWTTLSIM